MKISNAKRIVVEDFPKESRATMEKLSEIYNTFQEEVTDAINGQLDFDNLKRKKVVIIVTLDSNGLPQGSNQIKTGLTTYSGKNIIDVQNVQGGANVLSSPYLDCSWQGSGLVKVNKFHGLPLGQKLRITIEFIG